MEKFKSIYMSIKESSKEKLKKLAENDHRKLSNYIELVLENHIKEIEKNQNKGDL